MHVSPIPTHVDGGGVMEEVVAGSSYGFLPIR
jgi:hypothetical protein